MHRGVTIKGMALMLAASVPAIAGAHTLALDVNYETYTHNMGPAYSETLAFTSAPGGAVRTVAYLEHRRWRLAGQWQDGTTAQLAAYYDVTPAVYGVSQVQGADNTYLFPRFSAYQELGYKFGSRRQWALGAGVGYLAFKGGRSYPFVSLGPTYWFQGGDVGYRFTRYRGSENYNQRLYGEWSLTPRLKAGLSASEGRGFYPVCPGGVPCATALVASRSLAVTARYQMTRTVAVKLRLQRDQLDDRASGQPVYTGNGAGVSVVYQW